MWNLPNAGSNTKLYLYFVMDNELPAGGILNIAFPTLAALFTPTTCRAWALTTDLTAPTTDAGFIYGVSSGSGSAFNC